MLQNLSPYALLCASKPKPAPTVVTPYDLYSQAQSAAAEAPASSAPPQGDVQPAASAVGSIPIRRTHYIAGIQSRHSAALRRTPMQTKPLT